MKRLADKSGTQSSTPEHQLAAKTMATSLLPLLLQYLADSHDLLHTIAISPFATSILGLYKKEKKRLLAMTPEKQQFLTRLLDIVVSKMEYAADVEWALSAEGEEDDDELTFAEMRKNFCVVADAIAWIDPELYTNVTRQIVINTIDKYESAGAAAQGLTWQRVELATYLLYSFGPPLSTDLDYLHPLIRIHHRPSGQPHRPRRVRASAADGDPARQDGHGVQDRLHAVPALAARRDDAPRVPGQARRVPAPGRLAPVLRGHRALQRLLPPLPPVHQRAPAELPR